jgi:predicted lipoprotein with Yx(FWY)xxD motif
MKLHPMKCSALAAMIALSACNQDQAGDAGVDAAPEPTTTPSEAATQTPEPMPQTQPSSTTATPGTGGPGAAGQVSVMASQVAGPGGGSYITDAAGMAVYMLEGNTGGSKCTGACIEAWPPLLATAAQPTAGGGLQPDMLSTIKRPDGSTQLTYNGHPLHHYAADGGAGRTSGQGVKDQWGTWYLLSPQGEPVMAPAGGARPSQ